MAIFSCSGWRRIATHRLPGDFTRIFLLASVPALAAVLVVTLLPCASLAKPTSAPDVPDQPVRLSLQGFDSNFKRFLVLVALFTLSNSSDAFSAVARAIQRSLDCC